MTFNIRLPASPIVYDKRWADRLIADIENQFRIVRAPASPEIYDSVPSLEEGDLTRVFDPSSSGNRENAYIIATLIYDLKQKGILK